MLALEDRIRRLEDRAELEDLVVRYFIASDDDDFETLAEIFAPDGTFAAPGFVGGANREEVVAFLAADRRNMGATIHTPNFTLFNFRGNDHASGTVGAHLELARAGQTLFGAVRYRDEYTRVDGQWRISRREMLTIHVGPWDDVGTSLTAELNVRWPGSAPTRSHFPKKS